MSGEAVDWNVLESGPEGVRRVDGGGHKVEQPRSPEPQPRGAGAAGSVAVPRVVEMPPVMPA